MIGTLVSEETSIFCLPEKNIGNWDALTCRYIAKLEYGGIYEILHAMNTMCGRRKGVLH